jgi:hypothetical protein
MSENQHGGWSPPEEKPLAGVKKLVTAFGRVGYEAYAKHTGGKTYDGRDMPKWQELPGNIRDAWNEAGFAYMTALADAACRLQTEER